MGATALSAVGATKASTLRGRFGPTDSGVGSPSVDAFGNRTMTCVVTGSSSYATGGDTISLATLGLSEVREAWIAAFDSQSVNGGVSAEVVVTTPTAPTLKLYSAAATEVVSTTNVSTRTYIIRFVGR